jgi:hypothetical protein
VYASIISEIAENSKAGVVSVSSSMEVKIGNKCFASVCHSCEGRNPLDKRDYSLNSKSIFKKNHTS